MTHGLEGERMAEEMLAALEAPCMLCRVAPLRWADLSTLIKVALMVEYAVHFEHYLAERLFGSARQAMECEPIR